MMRNLLLAILCLGALSTAASAQTKIAVVSDLHYFDPSLLVRKGSSFQKYVEGDRKLLEHSAAIVASLVDSLIEAHPDVVLVSGDMTKDGELANHKGVIEQLSRLNKRDIPVLVVAGNHDVNNPESVAFDGDREVPVPTVTSEEFKQLYEPLMMNTVVARGPELCYVAEPVEGLWVISMDASQYQYNDGREWPVTEGKLSDEEVAWIVEQTREGIRHGKTVFGLMHQGLLEHFEGEAMVFPEYVIADWQDISKQLFEAGMYVVFTGHFHAQDIVERTMYDVTKSPHNGIYDIETGSVVTYPCPYRLMTLDGNTLAIETRHVEAVKGFTPGEFRPYAKDFLTTGMRSMSKWMLMGEPFNLTEEEAATLVPLLNETFIANYRGDETMIDLSEEGLQMLVGLSECPATKPIANGIRSLWHDKSPADNNVTLIF